MSITVTKIMFAIPVFYFCIKMIVQFIIGHFKKNSRMLHKAHNSMIYFFITACAITIYKGKGDFTPFTLNTKGVISLIMLITPLVLDWIDRGACE